MNVLNREVIQALGIPQQTIDPVIAREQRELERRERANTATGACPSKSKAGR